MNPHELLTLDELNPSPFHGDLLRLARAVCQECLKTLESHTPIMLVALACELLDDEQPAELVVEVMGDAFAAARTLPPFSSAAREATHAAFKAISLAYDSHQQLVAAIEAVFDISRGTGGECWAGEPIPEPTSLVFDT